MRPSSFASNACLFLLCLLPLAAAAQQSPPQPPAAPPAPVKPYKPLGFTPAAKIADPSFDAFRTDLATTITHKDRAGLGKQVVAKGFFWEGQSGDAANAKKSGLDNLAAAFDLEAKDGSGWEALGAMVGEANASPDPDHKGVVCAPAVPTIDDKGFEALTKATGTDPSEWAYPTAIGQSVVASEDDKAPVVGKLDASLVRVLPPSSAPTKDSDFVKVALADGKTGFVHAPALGLLDSDALCYLKDPAGWHVAGVVGGGGGQQ